MSQIKVYKHQSLVCVSLDTANTISTVQGRGEGMTTTITNISRGTTRENFAGQKRKKSPFSWARFNHIGPLIECENKK